MKKLVAYIVLLLTGFAVKGQEAFTIRRYDIDLKVNKDASLNVRETIDVRFTEPRHGIIRKIPYRYKVQELTGDGPKTSRPLTSGGYTRIILEKIQVEGWKFKIQKSRDYQSIQIGSANQMISGDQRYVISYRVLNAIHFFSDHSELYFNLIGNQWDTFIDSVNFRIELPALLIDTSSWFVATGSYGSRGNDARVRWQEGRVIAGNSTRQLRPYEGLTIGLSFPEGYLIQPDYRFRHIGWLVLPFLTLIAMLLVWRKWGKDEKVTVQTVFYPPESISPSISGYIIDGKINRRDLTALLPYWGAGGYLQIHELEKSFFLKILQPRDYELVKIKELPVSALQFEKTLFTGIFKKGNIVKVSELKDELYTTMSQAKSELESEINRDDYYIKYSRGLGCVFPLAGFVALVAGITSLFMDWQENQWLATGLILSGIILLVFGAMMPKKSPKGTLLYQQLLGFKEFIKTVEKDRLQEFLKQDENYFDKVLPYAIVFGIADTWKDRLKGLEVPPPTWYSGIYGSNGFNTGTFMNSLDHSMNTMSSSFNSAPHSSGGSYSGGGGFSGGGFGGGGGSSW